MALTGETTGGKAKAIASWERLLHHGKDYCIMGKPVASWESLLYYGSKGQCDVMFTTVTMVPVCTLVFKQLEHLKAASARTFHLCTYSIALSNALTFIPAFSLMT